MKLQNKMKSKKTVTARELGQLLTAKGFTLERITGDHKIYKKGDKTVSVNVRNLNRMVAQRLIKENGLLDEDQEEESESESESESKSESEFEFSNRGTVLKVALG